MPVLAVTICLSVAFRVLPSRRERLCFTTWMSVLKPQAAPPTLSQVHQRAKSGVPPSCCEPAYTVIAPAAITGRPPWQGMPCFAFHRVDTHWTLDLQTTPTLLTADYWSHLES